jgi:hypothetical protein
MAVRNMQADLMDEDKKALRKQGYSLLGPSLYNRYMFASLS